MPTVSQSAGIYLPRHYVFNSDPVGQNGNANHPSPEDVPSADISSSSIDQSSSSVKIVDVDNLVEIPTKTTRRLWPIVLGVALGSLLIIIAVVLISVLVTYFNKQNNSTSSTQSTSTTTTANPLAALCNATCFLTSRAALSTYTAAWTFENNLSDLLNNYNGTGVNTPGYTTGYTGQALSLTGTQYATTPFINFAYSSFTIEAWIKPSTLTNNGPTYAIFGECQISGVTRANCMQLLLRSSTTYSLYMGFGIDDLSGSTTVSSSLAGTWIHVAFVFDYSLRQQTIYRNGYADGQATLNASSPGAYVGTSGLINIGAQQTTNQFNGLIDHMFVTNRAKTACEILDDATLVAYYSFDSGSTQDGGPNYITGTATSGVTTITGHVNQAFAFGSSTTYFYFGNLVALGTSNQAFSFSLWVKPTAYTNGGTVLHIANGPNGLNNGAFPWCTPFMGFNSANRLIVQVYNGGSPVPVVGPILPLNVWTHVVETYGFTNGVTLYINGTQVGTTGSTNYAASGVPDYIFAGYYGPSGSSCVTGSIVAGIFSGAVDELRIYSRELTSPDVCVLANQ